MGTNGQMVALLDKQASEVDSNAIKHKKYQDKISNTTDLLFYYKWNAVVIPATKIHRPWLISSDFRPITLLPVLPKVLESFTANWIYDLLDPVLNPNQFGCLKGHSTAHALISVLHYWC